MQVVLARAADAQRLAVAGPARGRDRDRAVAAQERAGDRARLGEDDLERAVGDDLAAVLPGARPDVDDPVGGPDRLLVVLDDEDRVAEVAQPGQGRDELRVVALVEPDRRLVEDVQDAHQRRPDLGREPDPLGLAAGQRDARPVERQVVEPDVDEEPEPRDDLLEHLVGDRPLALAEGRLQGRRPAQRVRDRHRRDVPDVPVVDGHREDLRPEPLAAAGRARPGDHELLELGLDVVGVGLAVAPLEVRDDALERRLVRVLAALVAVADDDLLVLRSRGGRSRSPRAAGRGSAPSKSQPWAAQIASRIFSRHEASVGIRAHGTSAPAARLFDRSGMTRSGSISSLRAEAGAGRAGAVRRVEREAARLELVDGVAVVRAAVALAVAALLEVRRLAVAWRRRDQHDALAEPQRGLDRIGQPAGVRVRDDLARSPGRSAGRPARATGAVGRLRVADDVAVDDDLDRVALVLVERRRVRDVDHLAVDADADEALPPRAVEDAVALGLAVLDERAEDEQAGALRQREHLVDDLLDGLALDRVAVRAVRDADPREQQPEVVVDLGDRPDRGARVARGALLVDRDGRRQAVDLVDVRLLHLAEELAGVGAQALDVAALALGVDRVEGEAGLAAARTGR